MARITRHSVDAGLHSSARFCGVLRATARTMFRCLFLDVSLAAVLRSLLSPSASSFSFIQALVALVSARGRALSLIWLSLTLLSPQFRRAAIQSLRTRQLARLR